jgi:replicative DNA helicase
MNLVNRKNRDALSHYVFGQTMPQALEVEEAVLGAIILTGARAYMNVKPYLSPESFYLEEHKVIFEACDDLISASQPIDTLTIRQQIIENGDGDKVSSYFLATLSSKVSSDANLEAHARIVFQQATKRSLIEASSKIIADAYRPDVDAIALLTDAHDAIKKAAKSPTRSKSLVDQCNESFDMLLSRLESKNSDATWGIPGMDERVGTPVKGDMVVIGARPGMGKTALALSIAKANAMAGKRVWYFTKEMDAKALLARMACEVASVDSRKFAKKTATEKDIYAVMQAFETLSSLDNFKIFDNFSNMEEIETMIALSGEHPEVVFIDYLQLFTKPSSGQTIDQVVGAASTSCKNIAMRGEKCVVFALSQFSRDVEKRGGKKIPNLADLRGSGAIEQDAGLVLFIYRPKYYEIFEDESGNATFYTDDQGNETQACQLIIEKYRNGATGVFECWFRLHLQQFGMFAPKSAYDFKIDKDVF